LPLSVELQRAIDADETSRDFKKEYAASTDNVLDIPETTEWNEAEEEQQEDPSEEKSKSNLSKALKKIPTAKDWQELEQIKLHADKLYNAGDLIKADLDKISEAVAARLEQLDKPKAKK